MKTYIRFLRQGLIKAQAPKAFEKWDARQKMEWANECLAQLPDADLLKAMADFENPEEAGYFDEAPSASAIEAAEGEEVGKPIVQTKEWKFFTSAAGLTIVEEEPCAPWCGIPPGMEDTNGHGY